MRRQQHRRFRMYLYVFPLLKMSLLVTMYKAWRLINNLRSISVHCYTYAYCCVLKSISFFLKTHHWIKNLSYNRVNMELCTGMRDEFRMIRHRKRTLDWKLRGESVEVPEETTWIEPWSPDDNWTGARLISKCVKWQSEGGNSRNVYIHTYMQTYIRLIKVLQPNVTRMYRILFGAESVNTSFFIDQCCRVMTFRHFFKKMKALSSHVLSPLLTFYIFLY
jgi:hypothetical protein